MEEEIEFPEQYDEVDPFSFDEDVMDDEEEDDDFLK